jgi:hypothetical protein
MVRLLEIAPPDPDVEQVAHEDQPPDARTEAVQEGKKRIEMGVVAVEMDVADEDEIFA